MKIPRAFRVGLLLSLSPFVLTGCLLTGTSTMPTAQELDRQAKEARKKKEEEMQKEREKKYWEEYDVARRVQEEKARLKREKKRNASINRQIRPDVDAYRVTKFLATGELPDVTRKTARQAAKDQARRAASTAAREASIAAAKTAVKTGAKTAAKDTAKKAATTTAKPAASAHHP